MSAFAWSWLSIDFSWSRDGEGSSTRPSASSFPPRARASGPDILFVSNGRLEIIADAWLMGAPDLEIEILSASTAGRDRGIKRDLYERHGVAEYWIVDPEGEAVEAWRFGGDRRHERFTDRLPVRLGAETAGEIEWRRSSPGVTTVGVVTFGTPACHPGSRRTLVRTGGRAIVGGDPAPSGCAPCLPYADVASMPLNGGPTPADEVFLLLQRTVRERPDVSLEELNRITARATDAYNRRGRAELGGLSPLQVQRLLSADWESEGSALRLDEGLGLADLAGARTLTNAPRLSRGAPRVGRDARHGLRGT